MDGWNWKMKISYWGGLCSGAMLVLGRVYNLFIVPFFCRFGPPIVEIEKVHQNLTDVSWNKKIRSRVNTGCWWGNEPVVVWKIELVFVWRNEPPGSDLLFLLFLLVFVVYDLWCLFFVVVVVLLVLRVVLVVLVLVVKQSLSQDPPLKIW